MIKDIWKEHTELREKENLSLACCAKCTACCNQLVSCTWEEWKLIDEFLIENKLKGQIQIREKSMLTKWKEYRKKNMHLFNTDPLKPLREWQGRKCIFLNRAGLCDIYPVRPMNCRVITSTSPCRDLYNPNAKRFRWEYEKTLSEKVWKESPSMMLTDLMIGIKYHA